MSVFLQVDWPITVGGGGGGGRGIIRGAVYSGSLRYFNHRPPKCDLRETPVLIITVEPRFNEGPRDWQNMFAITRFRYIDVLFYIFFYYWGKENLSLYQGLRYV